LPKDLFNGFAADGTGLFCIQKTKKAITKIAYDRNIGGDWMNNANKRMETVVIHHGYDAKGHFGSLSIPIFQTSTFTFETAEQGEARFAGQEDGYIYSRLANPTVRALEEKMALLEGGEAALAFSSGMAAVSAVLFALTKANDHIICSQGVYGCTFGLLQLLKKKYRVSHDFCAMESEEDIRRLIRPETVCIYVETPINPTMKLIDLQMVVKVAKEHGITVVVDNTFCSPYLQRPLELGCDVVVHSATKYSENDAKRYRRNPFSV
jgi:methionine-gamma-lyase